MDTETGIFTFLPNYILHQPIILFSIAYVFLLKNSTPFIKVFAAIIKIKGTILSKYLELLSQKEKNKMFPMQIKYKMLKLSFSYAPFILIMLPISIKINITCQ